MKTRKPIAILAATAVAGLGLTALATPASANTQVDAVCEAAASTDLDAGDRPFVFYNDEDCDEVSVQSSTVDTNYISVKNSNNFPFSFDDDISDSARSGFAEFGLAILVEYLGPPVSGDIVVQLRSDVNTELVETYIITLTGGSAESVPAASPAPHIQQFENPAEGTCDEAQPEGLNWGGAASGGWAESWAQWANEGQGGPVCTRTLDYNNSTATWQVR